MKIVFPCSSKKNKIPFIHNNKEICFASQSVPGTEKKIFATPDEVIRNENITWRDLISKQENRNDLTKAYKLYKHEIYKKLYERFKNDLYIFSAGWGIVSAEFMLPNYDITFSDGKNIPDYAKRNKEFQFNDFNHLSGIDKNEIIIFIGLGKYLNSFLRLVGDLPNKKVVFYKDKMFNACAEKGTTKSIQFKRFEGGSNRKWHYLCAEDLINNNLIL